MEVTLHFLLMDVNPNWRKESDMIAKPMGLLLTVNEFAARTGWKPCTVRKKILRRELGYIKMGRSVRIPESELERLITNGFRPALRGTE
jgi:excisionase family DNA binding protein